MTWTVSNRCMTVASGTCPVRSSKWKWLRIEARANHGVAVSCKIVPETLEKFLPICIVIECLSLADATYDNMIKEPLGIYSGWSWHSSDAFEVDLTCKFPIADAKPGAADDNTSTTFDAMDWLAQLTAHIPNSDIVPASRTSCIVLPNFVSHFPEFWTFCGSPESILIPSIGHLVIQIVEIIA